MFLGYTCLHNHWRGPTPSLGSQHVAVYVMRRYALQSCRRFAAKVLEGLGICQSLLAPLGVETFETPSFKKHISNYIGWVILKRYIWNQNLVKVATAWEALNAFLGALFGISFAICLMASSWG